MPQPIAMTLLGVVHFGCGLLFLISGASKFLRPHSLAKMIANYRLVPLPMLPIIGKTLAATEMAIGILFVASLWLPVYSLAWILAFALILAFTAAIGSALARGLEIPCGCGLLLNGHVIRRATLVRNLALLCLLATDHLVKRWPLP
jgi:hypothetical protein